MLHKHILGVTALYINQVSATFYPILILTIDKPDFMKNEVTKKNKQKNPKTASNRKIYKELISPALLEQE